MGERRKGGNRRQEATRRFGMDYDVLSYIGNLCINKGGETGARKNKGTSVPFAPEENKFWDASCLTYMQRVAKVVADPQQVHP